MTSHASDRIPLFFILWGITIVGVIFKVFFVGKYNVLSTLLYLAMGWMAVFVYEPMLELLPFNGLVPRHNFVE